MALTAQKWSITGLSVELNMDRRTIAKALKDTEPAGKEGKATVYWMADVARVLFSPDGPRGDQLDLQHESARFKKAQADKCELEVEEKRANLISGDLVRDTWGNILANFRARIIGLPTTIAPRVVGLNLKDTEDEVRELVYQALDELKDYDPTDYGENHHASDRAGDGAYSGTAAEPDSERVGRRSPDAVKRGKRGTRSVANK